LYGNRGPDLLEGRGAFDKILGNDGDDKINGGNDGDNLEGNRGHDMLNGGPGYDGCASAEETIDCEFLGIL
jgi:hypothetical protein